MAANLDTFYSNINTAFINKATHMLRHWRIGSTANFCKTENELIVTVMYLNLLTRLGITGYVLTEAKINAIIRHLIDIYKIKGITDIDILSFMNQAFNNTTTIYVNDGTGTSAPYEVTYSGVDDFTVEIEWSGTYLPNVEIYELEIDDSYTRIYPTVKIERLLSTSSIPKYGISIIFASTSHGKIVVR